MTDGHVVTFNDVSFSRAQETILDNVSLTVREGDFSCIVGPNGSGKTTFLKLILGLLRPTAGSVRVFGASPEKARIRIGYMPQYASLDMQFPVTVMDVVLMAKAGKKFGGRYSKKDREEALFALSEVNMADHADHLFSELSGGQRQRVLIARALHCEPELLLLDEPTANVDPDTEEAFFTILQELNKRMTILFVSHDLGFVSKVVKSVICINRCVVVHPTSELDGNIIKEIYRGDICMIRHDHICSEEGHSHD